ncbi:MAG: cbb3-type cytochrome c oxidase subunit I [Armatimonadota bacterium]|nr:cbb3-type cytochrome c oxidase subunit I [Armatimonadota bacterium]MDR5698115.1 cbb3-type cytochrome c oxidase subunit I [Armatimonadota bacterium]
MLAWMLSDEQWSAARRFAYLGTAWALVGAIYELLIAAQLAWPGFLAGSAWSSHGRLVAVSRDVWIFGACSHLLIAAVLRLAPQSARGHLWGERTANLAFWLWTVAQVLAWWYLTVGWTRGRAFGEAPWPADLLRVVAGLLLLWVVWRTVSAAAVEPPAWYFASALVAFPLVLLLGKGLFSPFANPYAGVPDALAQAFLQSGLNWLWLGILSGGVLVALVPVAAGRAVFAAALPAAALLGILAFAPLAGPAAFVWGPVPFWTQTVGAVASLLLVLPAATLLVVVWTTVGGRWTAACASPTLMLFTVGAFALAGSASVGAVHGLLGPSRVVNLTLWVEGQRLLWLGGILSIAVGAAYAMLPSLVGRALASRTLAWWQVGSTVAGWAVGGLTLLFAGLSQGAVWATGTVPFAHGAAAVSPFLVVYAVSAGLLLTGQALFAWNVFLTVDSGEPASAAERDLSPPAQARLVGEAGT